jgi:hypothetical protein
MGFWKGSVYNGKLKGEDTDAGFVFSNNNKGAFLNAGRRFLQRAHWYGCYVRVQSGSVERMPVQGLAVYPGL